MSLASETQAKTDLQSMRDAPRCNLPRSVWVCQHQSCLRNGSAAVLAAFQAADLPPDVGVLPCECLGQCSSGPTVRVLPEETWYCRLQPEDVPDVVEQHLKRGEPLADKLHPRFHRSYW